MPRAGMWVFQSTGSVCYPPYVLPLGLDRHTENRPASLQGTGSVFLETSLLGSSTTLSGPAGGP